MAAYSQPLTVAVGSHATQTTLPVTVNGETPAGPPVNSKDLAAVRDWYAANTGFGAYFADDLGRFLTVDDLTVVYGGGDFLRTSRPGELFERLHIVNCKGIRRSHPDLTVRACLIDEPTSSPLSSVNNKDTSGTIIEYTTLRLKQVTTVTGLGASEGGVVRFCEVDGARSGVHLSGGGTLEWSYVHDQVTFDGSHNTGAACHGGTDVRIAHNYLEGSTSSALSLYAQNEPLINVDVIGNVLVGLTGSYTTYGGCSSKPYSSQNANIRYVGNWLTEGIYGYVTSMCSGPGFDFSNNREFYTHEVLTDGVI